MKKSTILKIINPVLLVLAVSQVLTGVFGGKLPSETFEIFHRDSGAVLLALIIFHLILNFNWVKVSYFRK